MAQASRQYSCSGLVSTLLLFFTISVYPTNGVTTSLPSGLKVTQPGAGEQELSDPKKCDQNFIARPGGPLNGTFTAPLLLNPGGHSRQCIYTFVAGTQQRVELVFTHFNLRGTPPDGSAMGVLPTCIHEYMDVYAEVQKQEPADLINTPFGGRYCGPIPPRRRISLYRTIALGFYTDKNLTTPELFAGRYIFINDSEYEVGTPVTGTPCDFIIQSTSRRTGVLLSPTYPGTYPKHLSCKYQFLGQPNQRVRVEFRDFDLFFGGPHCPFDYVKVYDGADNESALIGTYCGQQRNLVLYSSHNLMLVTFVTLQRTASTQNRGFKGIFEFSESFVKLDFIRDGAEHVRGSECDQKILSKKESRGVVYTPNYPYLYIPKLVCRYFIYGMQDQQHLERVRLELKKFDIPRGEKGDCSDGYLKIYLKGQEATDSYDKFDHEMCGNETNPIVFVSDGPRLVMVFSSGELLGSGFKANYTFETEYKIPGTAAPDGSCMFTYTSVSRKKGEFNSPRHPSNYPSDTNCTYLFVATPNEQVTIVFDHFKVRAENANTTMGAYGVDNCVEDWLELYQVYRFNNYTEKLVGRYCGLTSPGPIESTRGATGIKVVLHTDHDAVYSGFKARYVFETAKSIFGDCGSNVSSSGYEFGVITSPNYPSNYEGPGRGLASRTCNWFISVRPQHRISLYFDIFAMEGEPAGRGCSAAVVRLWTASDALPMELCGAPEFKWTFLSDANTMRLSFISADKSAGGQGFRAIWTEVYGVGVDCAEFTCKASGLCISNKLRCNRINNCGPNDPSDELNCLTEPPVDAYLFLMTSISGCALIALVLCIWCQQRRKRRRQLTRLRSGRFGSSRLSSGRFGSSRPSSPPPSVLPPPPPARHICDELGERFASMETV